MTIPKPKPPVKKVQGLKTTISVVDETVKKETKEKRPFFLKPHLTQRPFFDSQELREFKNKLV